MPMTHPLAITMEGYGVAGNLVLPEGASETAQVPGVLIVGDPGPFPLQRYSAVGARNWPVLWTEALGAAGLGGLCYDQRGSGLSTGEYHEADWNGLYEEAVAAAEMLAAQPEVSKTAAVAWADGCAFALRLAAEGKVGALVLLAPAYHTEEVRYAKGIRDLAARKGLSDRVVQLRVGQWQSEIMKTAARVQQGETTATVDLGGKQVTTNLLRFLQNVAYDPAPVAARVQAPVLLLHGADDAAIAPSESEAMARALPGMADRITYPGVAHFLYRHPQALKDAAAWLRQVLNEER
jgi:pimeloyl-ACP methyl ester carboxylesterase